MKADINNQDKENTLSSNVSKPFDAKIFDKSEKFYKIIVVISKITGRGQKPQDYKDDLELLLSKLNNKNTNKELQQHWFDYIKFYEKYEIKDGFLIIKYEETFWIYNLNDIKGFRVFVVKREFVYSEGYIFEIVEVKNEL